MNAPSPTPAQSPCNEQDIEKGAPSSLPIAQGKSDTPPTSYGQIALIGAPNAGKSTLVNHLIGGKVAIVSPKPQTTRSRIMGIVTHGNKQMVFVDSPGIFNPRRTLDRSMVKLAYNGIWDADIVAMVVDGRHGITPNVEKVIEHLATAKSQKKLPTAMLIINKVDIAKKDKLLALASRLQDRLDFTKIWFISAQNGEGVEEMMGWLNGQIPQGPWHFPEGQMSDVPDHLFASEITREQLYLQLHQELPFAAAVITEKMEHRPNGSIEIHQQIIVEKKSQRVIILGKQGSRIKSIGAASRKEFAAIMGRKVHLYLHVKVNNKWDEDKRLFVEFGIAGE